MKNDKDGIYLMPDWFQEKAREQVRKEIADAAGNDQTESKTAIRAAMAKEAAKLLGNSDIDSQDQTDKHIYI